MEAHSPQYFNPPPESSPSVRYTQNPEDNHQLEFQVQSWSNWVKFVSWFIIIISSIDLLRIVYLLSLGPDKKLIDIMIKYMIIELLYMGVGCLGCIVSNLKSGESAANYVLALILIFIVNSAIIASVNYDIELYACGGNEKQDSDDSCDSDDILLSALISGCLIFATLTCMCSPFIYCICKLRQSAEELEERRGLAPVGQDIQMMNYSPNSFVNLEDSQK